MYPNEYCAVRTAQRRQSCRALAIGGARRLRGVQSLATVDKVTMHRPRTSTSGGSFYPIWISKERTTGLIPSSEAKALSLGRPYAPLPGGSRTAPHGTRRALGRGPTTEVNI